MPCLVDGSSVDVANAMQLDSSKHSLLHILALGPERTQANPGYLYPVVQAEGPGFLQRDCHMGASCVRAVMKAG